MTLPEAEMATLNFQTMTLTGLKALKIARQRRNQQTIGRTTTWPRGCAEMPTFDERLDAEIARRSGGQPQAMASAPGGFDCPA